MRSLLFGRIVCVMGVALLGCGREHLVSTSEPTPPCTADTDCPDGQLCVFGECVDVTEFECEEGESALVQVMPLSVEMEGVELGLTTTADVMLTNVGECLLTVTGAGLSDGTSPGFSCSPCALTSYPVRLLPADQHVITVTYLPSTVGEALGALLLRSDDLTAGEEGLVSIPLHAVYAGEPVIVLDPPEVNFGYVPYIAGSGGVRTENVRITNQGTGSAPLTLQFIYVRPGADFSIPAGFGDVNPADPIVLAPYDPNDSTTWVDVPVTFAPTRNADQASTLVVHAFGTDPAAAADVSAALFGSSLGPPQIEVTPLELSFYGPDELPLSVGMVGYGQVMISNVGESDLSLELGLDDTSGDFSFTPSHLAPLAAGSAIALTVVYNPSGPSDPAHPQEPMSSRDAFFRIVSNDADNVLTTVTLHGWSKSGLSDDVLKIEMAFDNDAASWAQNDFRNVDLELISPLGMSCRKPVATYGPDGNGGYVAVSTRDFCGEWNDSGLEGHSAWLPGGVYEEPERVVLYGLAGADEGGEFEVRVHYAEDCSNMPTGILADLLGITASALLGILGGQVGVPIVVPPDQVSDSISENCWTHESSLVTVTTYINGAEVSSAAVRLMTKGESQTPVRILRQGGAFTVE